jgi:hypothetical protein
MPYKNKEDKNKNAREGYQRNKEKITAKRNLERDKINASAVRYREANREAINKRWNAMRKARIEYYHEVEQQRRDKNRDRINAYSREKQYGKIRVDELHDSYIYEVIFDGRKRFNLPSELIEAKKLQILIKRELKNEKCI